MGFKEYLDFIGITKGFEMIIEPLFREKPLKKDKRSCQNENKTRNIKDE